MRRSKHKVLIIDNYDSFTWNLADQISRLGGEPSVHRNDKITSQQVSSIDYSHIIISPGPCGPSESGISKGILLEFSGKVPILGVCLGHQVIAEAYGGNVAESGAPTHGKTSKILHSGSSILNGIPTPFEAARYHSLVVSRSTLPKQLVLTAWLEDGSVMAIEDTARSVFGIQFHPESFLTEHGDSIISNFLARSCQ